MIKNNDKDLNVNINEFKEKNMSIPIENQKTIAYYDLKGLNPESRVPIPTLNGVIKAKEWVEENQK